jgi:hypothetical protein
MTAAPVSQTAKQEKQAKIKKRWQGAKDLGMNYLDACALPYLDAMILCCLNSTKPSHSSELSETFEIS